MWVVGEVDWRTLAVTELFQGNRTHPYSKMGFPFESRCSHSSFLPSFAFLHVPPNDMLITMRRDKGFIQSEHIALYLLISCQNAFFFLLSKFRIRILRLARPSFPILALCDQVSGNVPTGRTWSGFLFGCVSAASGRRHSETPRSPSRWWWTSGWWSWRRLPGQQSRRPTGAEGSKKDFCVNDTFKIELKSRFIFKGWRDWDVPEFWVWTEVAPGLQEWYGCRRFQAGWRWGWAQMWLLKMKDEEKRLHTLYIL